MRETDSVGLTKEFMQKNNYKYINMIGKGGFGKVWKVKHLNSGQVFAMKEMSKATLLLINLGSLLREVLIPSSTRGGCYLP